MREEGSVLDERQHARLRELNSDHRVRIDAEREVRRSDGREADVERLDARSRDDLVRAMQNCVERYGMGTERANVLELGAGDGRDIGRLRDAFHAEYSGVEVVPHTAAALATRGVICSPIESLPQEWSGRFSFVYSRHVMEHVVDLDAALAEISRVLAPNGVVGAITPHYFPDPEPAHVTQQTVTQWIQHYRRHGLRPVYATLANYNCIEAHIVAIHEAWPLENRV